MSVKYILKKNIFAFFIFLFLVSAASAQDQERTELVDVGDVVKPGVKFISELFVQASTLPEAKIGFNQHFKFPVMQGDGSNPLFKNNNIDLVLSAEVTPVSLDAIVKAVWEPIAFLQFTAGTRFGSGWSLKLFGGELYGIGFNTADDKGGARYDGSAFDALNWRVFGGGLFQFDLAALIPGDWTHVVVQTYHEFSYRANTRAKNGESWYYENDDGENQNGVMYFGNITLGYQMPKRPIFLNMIAIQAEMEMYFYDDPGRENWGDDLMRWRLAPILQFSFTDNLELYLIAQFWTRRNFTNYKYSKSDNVHYKHRILDTSNPIRMEFYRAAIMFMYRF
ncbi:MAG: hypothetical protein FWB73_07680 [Treponema sp.]|nr:hypothetical protein [Treponema sp.]